VAFALPQLPGARCRANLQAAIGDPSPGSQRSA